MKQCFLKISKNIEIMFYYTWTHKNKLNLIRNVYDVSRIIFLIHWEKNKNIIIDLP